MKEAKDLKFPLKGNYLAMLAPSFVVDFSYPEIVFQLKKLGFKKIVELTFGAKVVNHEYHSILKKSKELKISSVCPGVVETLSSKNPEFKKNLMPVVSPMIAMAKICKKNFPNYQIVFISPCNFKKLEARKSGVVDGVICYNELKKIIQDNKLDKIKINKNENPKYWKFDSFYNEYTKIYPIAGGLYKTAHLKGIIKEDETKIIDSIVDVLKFLNNKDNLKNIKFLDVNFCKGGCIGGPCITCKLSLQERKKKVFDYLKLGEKTSIPKSEKGNIEMIKGISLRKDYS